LAFLGIAIGLCGASLLVPLIHHWAKRDLKEIQEKEGPHAKLPSGDTTLVRYVRRPRGANLVVLDGVDELSRYLVLVWLGCIRAVWIWHLVHFHL